VLVHYGPISLSYLVLGEVGGIIIKEG
jgi:hypothetical protein